MLFHPVLVLMPVLAWVDGQTGQRTSAVENKPFVLRSRVGFLYNILSREVNLRYHLVQHFMRIGAWMSLSSTLHGHTMKKPPAIWTLPLA